MKFQAGLQSECLRRAGVPQSGCKMHQGAVRPHWPQVLSPSGLAEVQPDPSSPLPAWPRTRVSGVAGRTGGLRLSGTRPSLGLAAGPRGPEHKPTFTAGCSPGPPGAARESRDPLISKSKTVPLFAVGDLRATNLDREKPGAHRAPRLPSSEGSYTLFLEPSDSVQRIINGRGGVGGHAGVCSPILTCRARSPPSAPETHSGDEGTGHWGQEGGTGAAGLSTGPGWARPVPPRCSGPHPLLGTQR